MHSEDRKSIPSVSRQWSLFQLPIPAGRQKCLQNVCLNGGTCLIDNVSHCWQQPNPFCNSRLNPSSAPARRASRARCAKHCAPWPMRNARPCCAPTAARVCRRVKDRRSAYVAWGSVANSATRSSAIRRSRRPACAGACRVRMERSARCAAVWPCAWWVAFVAQNQLRSLPEQHDNDYQRVPAATAVSERRHVHADRHTARLPLRVSDEHVGAALRLVCAILRE